MMVVLEDDGCLHAYESPEAVTLQIEALDAEDVLRAVFDQNGQRYRVDWIQPNRHGWFGSVTNGIYRLVADGQPDSAALLDLIRNHPASGDSADAIQKIQQRLNLVAAP